MERFYHPLLARTFFIFACVLIVALLTMTALHSIIPHVHPGDPAHHDTPTHNDEPVGTYTSATAHGNEEKVFLALVTLFCLTLIRNVDVVFNRSARVVLARQRAEIPRRKPPYLRILFARGILHSRVP